MTLVPTPADDVRRISVWSGPRNVSTALMYAFRQRSDTRVFDEPLYGPYLATAAPDHPAREAVLAQLESDAARVIREVLLAPGSGEGVRFFKNMAHHLRGLDPSFLARLDNALLIRDPREMLPSLARQMTKPGLADTGFPEQVWLLERLLEEGRAPVVIDAKRLRLDPEGVLRRACDALDLPFEAAMLAWPAGPKPEDGPWAPHWYANVHASTGFTPFRPASQDVPGELDPVLQEAAPLYARLAAYAL